MMPKRILRPSEQEPQGDAYDFPKSWDSYAEEDAYEARMQAKEKQPHTQA